MMANADINGDGITEVCQNSEKEQLIAFKSFLYDDLCEYKAEADDLSKYDDFHTIDWSRDRMRDRMRLRKVSKLKNEGNTLNKVKGFYDALSGWLIVFIVGITTGLFGGIIVITSEWVTDLKEGVCKSQILFNKQTCCWNAEVGKLSIDGCKEWVPWSDIFNLNTFSQRESYIFNFFCYVFSALLFSGISVSLVRFFAPYASGSGIAEVKTILGGFVIKGFLGWWTLLIKSVALIFSVSTGLKLGMEGPMVHIGTCVGNVIVRLFPKYHGNEAKRREVLSAAAASGVSVAFGAPIGGVLFSLEEISYYFSMKILWRTFLCSMMAALTIWYLNPYGNGHLVIYSIDYNIPWNLFEIIPFILLGIYGGCFGAFFIKCNIFWCRMRKTKKFGSYPMTEVFVLTIFTALISYPNEFTRMSMSQLIYMLFQNCSPDDTSILWLPSNDGRGKHKNGPQKLTESDSEAIQKYVSSFIGRILGPGVYESIWKLVVATLVISIMTVLTFGVKLPAGLFVPSLAAGACAGRVMGIGIEALVESYPTFFLWSSACSKSKTHCILPGLYSMAGAAAALGGVTRMTVTLVVIMFEVTGGLTYVAPIMIVVITCKWVGEALAADSVYIEHIRLKGFPYLNTKEEYDEAFLASDIMQPSRYGEPLKCILKNGSTVKDIETLLVETKFNGFPIIVDNEFYRLSGFVTRRDLKVALHYGKLRNKNCDSSSLIYFSKRFPSNEISQDVSTLSFRHILDLSPFTVTDSTPVVIVIDMFQKLGLRQVLVTHGGKLLGIITKKDVLRHIAQVKHFDPGHILYD